MLRLVRCSTTLGPSARIVCTRKYASAASVVDLDSSLVTPENGNKTEGPLVILHGLFGSKRNWGSLSKSFSSALNRPVYALDLRNHGTSPHSKPMDYRTMAEDVSHWIQKNGLSNVALLGHSMGGKVAMALALANESPIEKLVVADIAPSRGTISREFQDYIRAMQAIEEAKISSRKEATNLLSQWEKDPTIQAFLLTNLDVSSSSAHAKFRIPISIISEEIASIGDFPYEANGETTFDKPTLFVKGTRSRYINEKNTPIAKKLFPNMEVKTLDAGHWVHAEKPREFQSLLVDFVGRL